MATDISNWVLWAPSVVGAAGLAGVVVMNRINRKDAKEEIGGELQAMGKDIKRIDIKQADIRSEMAGLKQEYLTESKHQLLCENASLKVNDHITKELNGLKDVFFKQLRSLDRKIDQVLKNGGSHDIADR